MNFFFLIYGWFVDFDIFWEMNIVKFLIWVNKLYKKNCFYFFLKFKCIFLGVEWFFYRDCYVLFLNNIIGNKWK